MSDTYDPADEMADATSIAFDSDGDGLIDSALIDTDGDGVADGYFETDPYSGASALVLDSDGDGVADTFVADYDGDGQIDEMVVTFSGDGPAMPGTSDGPFAVEDGDGEEDLDDDDVDAVLTVVEDEADGAAGDEVEPGIHGDPRADVDYHQVQPGPVDCLPTSVSMVLSEITGTDIPAQELVDLANESGFMTEDGMAPVDAVTLLEHYGVEAEVASGTVDDLRAALDAGDPVIIGLDSADLYSGGGGPFDPGMESGHAVVITGIDDGPPAYVYINDPGFPDGAGVEIPLELFEDAWEDSDNTMVVATAGGGDETVTAGAEGVGDRGDDEGVAEAIKRVLLLPLNFVVRA